MEIKVLFTIYHLFFEHQNVQNRLNVLFIHSKTKSILEMWFEIWPKVVNQPRAAPKRKVAQAPLRKGSSKGKLSEKSDGETAKKAAEQEERERLEQVEIAEKKRAWRARQDEKRRQKEAEDAEADRRMREHHEILRRQRDERANREKELFVSKWQ